MAMSGHDLSASTAANYRAFVVEARKFNAAAAGAKNTFTEVDPSTPEGLEAHRTGLSVRPTPDGPAAEELVAEASGRQVPVRVTNAPPGQAP